MFFLDVFLANRMHTHIGLLGLEPKSISTFVKTMNQLLAEAEDALSRRVLKQAEFLTDGERQELYNDSADESIALHVCVPFVNRALLIAAFSNFEDSLKNICKDAYSRGLSTQSVSETRFYIGHAYDYLVSLSKGSARFNIAALGEKWSEINDGCVTCETTSFTTMPKSKQSVLKWYSHSSPRVRA